MEARLTATPYAKRRLSILINRQTVPTSGEKQSRVGGFGQERRNEIQEREHKQCKSMSLNC